MQLLSMEDKYEYNASISCGCFTIDGNDISANNCSGITTQEGLDLKIGADIKASCKSVVREGRLIRTKLFGKNCAVVGLSDSTFKVKSLVLRGFDGC